MTHTARRLWQRLEPVHDVTYFSPHSREQADALGMRGYWMGYFAFRAAPLGPVGPAVVTAAFYGFHPSRVARALPDAWAYASPAQALAAREAGAAAAIEELGGGRWPLAEAAELAWRAARAADVAGRPLAAANQALPRPAGDAAALWLAATVLREHRGDGHNAVLLARGIGPAEAHLVKAAAGEADEEAQRSGRGWPEPEWARARARLADRGLLAAGGGLTDLGRQEHAAIEAATDAAAARPWQALGAAGTARLADLLAPLAAAVADTGLLPRPNPAGLVLPAS
jgi:hypothetical protein